MFCVCLPTPVQLELRTSENPLLRPENPRQVFTLAEGAMDDVQFWDQTFAVEAAPRRRVVRSSRPSNSLRPQPIRSHSIIRSFRR